MTLSRGAASLYERPGLAAFLTLMIPRGKGYFFTSNVLERSSIFLDYLVIRGFIFTPFVFGFIMLVHASAQIAIQFYFTKRIMRVDYGRVNPWEKRF